MKVIKATQQMLETRTLVLGFQGENLRTQLRIDCASTFAEYPNATPALAIKPPSGETYPVFVERDGNEVVWNIVANNLLLKGDGELQLTFYKDNVIAKTYVGHIRVNRSLQIDGEMPDVVATWIENANRKLAEVDAQIVELEGMVDTATDAATRAEQSASTASTKAEQAAGSAATATEKATEATNAAGTATAKAAEAALSATQAGNSAVSAADSERIASSKAGEANTAAGTATAKAGQATEAAQTATEKAGDASASARAAQTSATNAASSATAASESETAAKASETAASTSATQAAQSVQDAGANAQTATQKAAEATQSASNAATSATNAATSAETASTKAGEAAASAQAASDAKTAVEQTAEQLADSLEQIAQNTQDIADHEQYAETTYATKDDLYKKADIIHNTASGAIASFPDGADGHPVDELKVSIEPVQDLHGYDHPWPAGGGKNKANLTPREAETINGITSTVGNNNLITASGTSGNNGDIVAYLNPAITLTAGQAYTISLSGIDTRAGSMYVFVATPDVLVGTMSSTIHSITYTPDSDINCDKIRLRLYKQTVTINANLQLESGSIATAWSPYANICPISGWDEVNVWDDSTYGGTVEWNQIQRFTVGTSISEGVTYTLNNDGSISCSGTSAGNSYISIGISIENVLNHVLYIRGCPSGGSTSTFYYRDGYNGNSVDRDIGNGRITKGRSRFIGQIAIWKGTDATGLVFKPQCFDITQMFGETKAEEIYAMEQTEAGAGIAYFRALFPNDFYAYNTGETMTVGQVNGEAYRHYTIEMPTEAGTVYGGELTVNADGSGSLVVDTVKAIADGTIAPTTVTDAHTAQFGSKFPLAAGYSLSETALKCNRLKPSNYSSAIDNLIFFPNATIVTMKVSAEVTDWVSWLSNNPVEFSYKIANPQTYTLTASEIRTLLGQNNVWADTGDVTVKYNADTKLYIDGKIAELVAQIVNS